jgi:uncharacterized protein YqjF (DUF2071 family)
MSDPPTIFKADWLRPVFIHFRVDAGTLQRSVPFELHAWDGDAIASLVAFTQSRLRPTIGGRLGAWLSAPLATHEFLNLRTYVRHGDDRGIFFLAEWIPNRIAALIGPATYGLLYRLGRLRYRWHDDPQQMHALVRGRDGAFAFDGHWNARERFQPATPGTLEHFLVERYTAFTARGRMKCRFRVDHAPWPIAPMNVVITDLSLAQCLIPQLSESSLMCAQFSPGVTDVSISAPEIVARPLRSFLPA